MLLDLVPGDEVICPSFTFPSVANAVVARGAVPVFVDVTPDTFNLDPALVADAVTARTRAVIAVHYGGVACDLAALQDVCARHDLELLEDNAHGLGGAYRGKPLGSFGRLAVQSFHATKNVQCGEGGALVVNDTELLARAEIIREKGTDRRQMQRGQVDKYVWRDLGSSYLLADLLAAILWAQLEDFAMIQKSRREVWDAYSSRLADWREAHGVTVQRVPEDCEHPAHVFAMVMPTPAERDRLMASLLHQGVVAAFHYQPLDSSPAGQRWGRTAAAGCPVTSQLGDRLVRLPLFSQMTADELDRIVEAVRGHTPGSGR